MIAPWPRASARRCRCERARQHRAHQRIARGWRAQAIRALGYRDRARPRRRHAARPPIPWRARARGLPVRPRADPGAPGRRTYHHPWLHRRESHPGGARVGAARPRLASRAGRRRPDRSDAVHEPLLQHQVELQRRRLLAGLAEDVPRLEPRVRSRPPDRRHQAGRPRPSPRRPMSTADAIIVGGGVTGCSLAFQLAGLGLRRVLVLERRFIGAGGTGRSVGIIRQLYPTPETTQMVTRSLRVFERFHEAVAGESGFVRSGALIGVSAAMRRSLEKTLALQRGLGVEAGILEPAELARIEPSIDASSLGAVLYEPGSGYGDPTAVTAGYAEAARKRGAIIEQGQEVTVIHQSGGRITGVTTAAGDRIDTPVVVNAAGLWSPAVARLAGIELPIIIGRPPVFVIERGPDFGRPHMVYLDLAGGSYVRPETGGFTLTGSLTDDETQHPMDPELLGAEPGFDEAEVALERTSRSLASSSPRACRGTASSWRLRWAR